MGCKVVTASDSNGYIYDPNGIQLDVVKDIKLGHRGRIKGIRLNRVPGLEYHEGFTGVWTVPCDILLPCATQNEIDEESAKTLIRTVAPWFTKVLTCLPLQKQLLYTRQTAYSTVLQRLQTLVV